MTISDFINLCIDPSFLKIEIWESNSGKTIYEGWAEEAPDELLEQVVDSYDVPTRQDTITFNISLD